MRRFLFDLWVLISAGRSRATATAHHAVEVVNPHGDNQRADKAEAVLHRAYDRLTLAAVASPDAQIEGAEAAMAILKKAVMGDGDV